MKKPAGYKAYEHYLATGTVFGMYEGAVQRGKGPPASPMTFEQFLAKSRSLPKPHMPAADRSDPRVAAELGKLKRRIIGIDD